jgi:hypothetical protein
VPSHSYAQVVRDYRGELSIAVDTCDVAKAQQVKAGYRAAARQFLVKGAVGGGTDEVRGFEHITQKLVVLTTWSEVLRSVTDCGHEGTMHNLLN